LEEHGVDGRMIIKYALRKEKENAQTGLFWLRIGTRGGLL
jgi:hypothetical protein